MIRSATFEVSAIRGGGVPAAMCVVPMPDSSGREQGKILAAIPALDWRPGESVRGTVRARQRCVPVRIAVFDTRPVGFYLPSVSFHAPLSHILQSTNDDTLFLLDHLEIAHLPYVGHGNDLIFVAPRRGRPHCPRGALIGVSVS
ncbi:hypothetical protein JQU17_10715 [Ponticoccus sp. SC2-23]|uniref:hypothetical protein n=1 Tax=Alexandriicola marinus TaxID=2081710 RepID=UPI000FD7713B|nr:hypothetical protein [Alexandriicola marinus]MBM1221362.1 hypothetical protein [Ponticoccus sp. SC6-9]MBM1226403.1 hypothetical protein [Ponticoccus sp. SC6-15]MBM1230354.1 hypothetical protein [Ponticoccus sp. SC6-38]MBM1234877.1 hypothetical protein [Ponticoccus sp. SC6-45]MBM1239375.1 hypothetical protein [Ponticoccus sp. SC6-49]MBM1243157.1 hypothetical protein [Ponticoccus sp. SC2-64]MBM1248401.1 hypothetical protein [Ponticoccus sp. SC6-42]MBM1252986.1 hypothetical protein [Pontico